MEHSVCPVCGSQFYDYVAGNSNPDAPDFGPEQGHCTICGFGFTSGATYISMEQRVSEYVKGGFVEIVAGLARSISRTEQMCADNDIKTLGAIPALLDAARNVRDDFGNGEVCMQHINALADALKRVENHDWELDNPNEAKEE